MHVGDGSVVECDSMQSQQIFSVKSCIHDVCGYVQVLHYLKSACLGKIVVCVLRFCCVFLAWDHDGAGLGWLMGWLGLSMMGRDGAGPIVL